MAVDLAKIEDTPHLLDTLVQMEDVLDSLDLYVYRNWIDGEVVDGPRIGRHWATFSLLYQSDHKPDPRATTRLMKQGVRVHFDKVEREGQPHKPQWRPASEEEAKQHCWMVKISIPRRLLDQNAEANVDMYDDDVDADDVAEAEDSGLDAETGYQSPDASDGGFAPPDVPPGGMPGGTSPGGGPPDAAPPQ